MKAVGLIVMWIAMTINLIFWHTSIEDMRSFLFIYVLVTVYLVYVVVRYAKKGIDKK